MGLKAVTAELRRVSESMYDIATGHTSEKGDGSLHRLSFWYEGGSGAFLFADEETAKAAAKLMEPLGYSIQGTSAAPYFTSLAAFKKSKWFRGETKRAQELERQNRAYRRARAFAEKWKGKYFSLPKKLSLEGETYPAGTAFRADFDMRSFELFYKVAKGGGITSGMAVELDSRDDTDELNDLLDLLDKAKEAPRLSFDAKGRIRAMKSGHAPLEDE